MYFGQKVLIIGGLADFSPDIRSMKPVAGWRPTSGLKEGWGQTAAGDNQHQALNHPDPIVLTKPANAELVKGGGT
jgi:hypothetical protein